MANANDYSLDFERSTTDYVSISHASQTGLSITGPVSVMAWIDLESSPGNNSSFTIASKLDSSGGYELGIFTTSGAVRQLEGIVRQNGSTIDTIRSNVGSFLNNNIFAHVCMVADYSGGPLSMKLYINGRLLSTTAGTTTAIGTNTAEFAVGARAAGSQHFDGLIDEVKVFNAALTNDLVVQLMREDIAQTSLKGFWKFNNNLFDSSSSANHLSVANGSPAFATTVPFLRYGRTDRYFMAAGDGYVENTDVGLSTTRSASSGTSADYTSATLSVKVSKPGFSTDRTIDRGFLPVDTTTHPAGATTIDAYLGVHKTGSTDNPGNASVCLVQATPSGTSSLVTSDFSQCGTVNSPNEGMTRILLDDTIINCINYWHLNSTGNGWLNPGGYTRLGLRMDREVDNTDFSGSSAREESIQLATSENSSSLQYPHLDIQNDYTPPDILDGASTAAPGTGGVPRGSGGAGSPGYTPGGSGSANGGSSAGETALFFGTWLDN